MEIRWNTFGLCLRIYICLISVWGIRDCWSINDEGLALLAFQARITFDPFNALVNWNPNDCDPCKWLGVHCVDGKVQMLELKGLSLEGTLAPELGKLSHLNSIVWQRNFNQWYKSDSLVILTKATLTKCANTFAWPLFKLGKTTSHGRKEDYCDILPSSNVPKIAQNVPELVSSVRRKLLQSSGNNLAATPFSDKPTIEFSTAPTTFSSGAFPAVPDANKKQNQLPASLDSPPGAPDDASDENQSNDASDGNQTSQQHLNNGASGKMWKCIIIIFLLLMVFIMIILLYIWRKRAAKVIGPWKTGISGQLQKAFITGVPKLNRAELDTACEDFSNIVVNGYYGCTIYKGTLSNGVEIAVVSTQITSSKNWSKSMEMKYRKKIDTLSRINHKNFINLIGYCEEEEPFTRMLVFEYAPNGNLFEHLHVEDMEHLDWSERIRIIMGVAYCLQYMHHDLNPPVGQSKLVSDMIFLTDDFAAKIAEVTFQQIVSPDETVGDSKKSDVSSEDDLATNIYDFGELLLEIISGKLLYSEEHGDLVKWASKYLKDKTSFKDLIDPTLQSFKDNDLNTICEVIQDCIQPDPKLRPTMRDVTSKLREVLGVSPEQAVPRLSPLWWAELEILSVEAT